MPIPTPTNNESRADFLNRCMTDNNMISEYPENQRYAVCVQSWNESDKKVNYVMLEQTKKAHQKNKEILK